MFEFGTGKRVLLSVGTGAVAVFLPNTGWVDQTTAQLVTVAAAVVIALVIGPPIIAAVRPRVIVRVEASDKWREWREARKSPAAPQPPESVVGPTPEPSVHEWGIHGEVEQAVHQVPSGDVPLTSDEPTYKGQAMMGQVIRAMTQAQKDAEPYRDDDPTLGQAYSCPSCDFRTYTPQGAVSMLKHIIRRHGGPPDSEEARAASTALPPGLRGVPAEHVGSHIASMCEKRAGLLTRGQRMLDGLWELHKPTDNDYRSYKTTFKTWNVDVSAYGKHPWGQTPEQIHGEGRKLSGESMPQLEAVWVNQMILSVRDRMAWLKKHGSEQCDS